MAIFTMLRVAAKAVFKTAKLVVKAGVGVVKGAVKVAGKTLKGISKAVQHVTRSHRTKRALSKFDEALRDSGYQFKNGQVFTSTVTIAAVGIVIKVVWDLFDKYWKKPDLTSNIMSKLPDLKLKYTVDEVDVTNTEDITYRKLKSGNYAIGARHNNPMNVRPHKKGGSYDNNYWQGQDGVYSTKKSGDFAYFTDPYYSIRAAALSINNYTKNHRAKLGLDGKLTLRRMLNIYAPPSENDTNEYLNFVVKQTGIHPDTEISMQNKRQFVEIIRAMALMESQVVLSREYLGRVWEAIFNNGPKPLQHTSEVEPVSIQVVEEYNSYTSNKNNNNK